MFPPAGTTATAIALFEHRNFTGHMVILCCSTPYLHKLEFEDQVTIMIALGKSWKIMNTIIMKEAQEVLLQETMDA